MCISPALYRIDDKPTKIFNYCHLVFPIDSMKVCLKLNYDVYFPKLQLGKAIMIQNPNKHDDTRRRLLINNIISWKSYGQLYSREYLDQITFFSNFQ